MISMTATMDGAASRAFQEALKLLAKSAGETLAIAPRKAAIQLCKNFRAGTREAGSRRPVNVTPLNKQSDTRPPWITWEKGVGRLRPPKRLISIDFPDRTNRSDVRRYVKGRALPNWQKAAEKDHGHLYRFGAKHPTGTRGLAKRSWGWVMHNIFNGLKPDAPWQRRKGDRRNPMDATTESTSSGGVGPLFSSGYARICNRLDYIKSALTIDENAAARKAASAIIRTLESKRLRKRGGLSDAEIRAEAGRIAEEFKQKFPD